MGNYNLGTSGGGAYGSNFGGSGAYGSMSGSWDAMQPDPPIDPDVLKNVFDSDATDVDSLESMLENIAKEGFKELDAHSEKEKDLKGGIHLFGQFKAAMKAAFPGWPADTTEATEFAAAVIAGKTGKSADAIFKASPAIRPAFDRFVKTLYPQRTKPFPDAKAYGILKILSGGVKYCTDSMADKYKVTLGSTMTRGGNVFDSQDLFNEKTKRYLQGTIAGGDDWTKCRSIWVMAWDTSGQPEFFTHIGKIGRFHHSSFKAGEAIMAAGEWVISQGECKMINSCSGHYRPESWRLLAACIQLKNHAVLTPRTVMEVWRKDNRQRELVNCLQFIASYDRSLQTYQLFP
jgi:hypothetical protein